jgi:hypothetical protein
MHFVSNKLKEDVASRYDTYLASERAMKGEDLGCVFVTMDNRTDFWVCMVGTHWCSW